MRFHRIPPVSALRAFEATARLHSVTKAAIELNVTNGAISHAIREVETAIGAPLFERRHRVIKPLPSAMILADTVADILKQLGDAFDPVRFSSGSIRPLVFSCEPTFLMRWLIPRLSELKKVIGSEREMHLVAAGGKVDFAREGVDLAIRRSDFPMDQDTLAKPFMSEWIGPVCRSDMLSTIGRRGQPLRGVHLHTTTRIHAWKNWSQLTGNVVRPDKNMNFNHFYLSLQAAVAGVGVAIGPIALVLDDLKNKTLHAPCGFVQDGTQYMLLASKSFSETEGFGNVLDWLVSSAKECSDFLSSSSWSLE